ncbi:hypothetical protein LJ737_04180 [Hymenobacter sp. 15J16-1T3B]|uniref:DUF6549 family protein n=1 Tax=Hymenobacter sp. 15J16-1T3B TaxID=2886941 RepID=UPI001D11EAF2|nr:DUF6549 family protein [Hymenobacter sp. 15J16-1T3B]MCC3156420.1 hypothetical protein [Hymenobacter sp. 15J16-1T3B]
MSSPFSTAWRLFGVACFLLLISMAFGAYQWFRSRDWSTKYLQTRNYYEAREDSLVKVRDAAGRETVVYKTTGLSPATLKQLRYGLAAELRDQLREEFGRSAQLLFGQRASVVTAQQLPAVALRDTVLRIVTKTDTVTVPAKAATYRDAWLTLTAAVLPGDSLSATYKIRNEFDVRAYSKRDAKHWWQFWKPRRVFVDLKNKNPNTTTDKMEAVLVEKE